MAFRLSLKQAVGAVGAGALSEKGQCNHALMRIAGRKEDTRAGFFYRNQKGLIGSLWNMYHYI